MPKGRRHWNWNDKPSILALHKRIHRKHGAAKLRPCARECGRMANDWALKIGREYSDNVNDYEPLCRKCHIAQDDHPSKVDRSKHRIIRDEKGRFVTTVING